MKYIVRKAYWDYEKEEKWLNEMSAKGLALSDYSWCRYVFTDAPNNAYTYRIELLENLPTHPESTAYLRFLEESGIECVASYMRWVYLRKKTEEGPFDIYTDIDSKIKHYQRINVLLSTMMWIEFLAGFVNIVIGILSFWVSDGLANHNYLNLIVGIAVSLLGVLFLNLVAPLRAKIKSLKREKAIRE